MKAFTDLEQSKKLAKILPLESADMHYSKDFDSSWFVDLAKYTSVKIPKYVGNIEEHLLPCWSLAALLGVLPYPEIWQDHSTNRWAYSSLIKDIEYLWESENPVDSCVEVIIKLHKEGLL